MKNILFLQLSILLISCSGEPRFEVIISNPSELVWVDEGVIVARADLEQLGPIPAGRVPVLKDQDNKFVPSQADDMDGDGAWDELFTIIDLGPGQSKQLHLLFTDPEKSPDFEARTNIRFARKDQDYKEVSEATRETHAINTETQKVWQMEGIAWENDRVGFRNYFDRRNGMDIFGKVTTAMVLDQVGDAGHEDYHTFNPDWGVDVLKVGNSLGAGSIAYRFRDSLYRVGDNGTGTCRVLAEGPLRSIARFEFDDWHMGDQSLDVIHDVSIEAGKYYYTSRVSYVGTEEEISLVTGIVNMKSSRLYETGSDSCRAYYTFDLQAEDTTLMGMGIMVDAGILIDTLTMGGGEQGIVDTYCILMKAHQGQAVSFRFYSVWERENVKWKTAGGFGDLLRREALSCAAPPIITLTR